MIIMDNEYTPENIKNGPWKYWIPGDPPISWEFPSCFLGDSFEVSGGVSFLDIFNFHCKLIGFDQGGVVIPLIFPNVS